MDSLLLVDSLLYSDVALIDVEGMSRVSAPVPPCMYLFLLAPRPRVRSLTPPFTSAADVHGERGLIHFACSVHALLFCGWLHPDSL